MPELNALVPNYAVQLLILSIFVCYYSKATAMLLYYSYTVMSINREQSAF